MEILKEIKNDIDIVIYHYPCMDGFSAWWIAQHYYKIINKPIVGIPKSYDSKFLDENIYLDKNILMVDILTKDYELIKSKSKNLIILDHHKTSQELLNNISYAYFDMNKSGAGLIWEYFFDQKPPMFIQLIQDRDLYTFKLERSKDFNEGLFNWLFAFAGNDIEEKIMKFNELYDDEVPKYVSDDYRYTRISLNKQIADMGQVMNLVKDNKIESIAKNTQVYHIETYIDDGKMIKNAHYKVAITECSHDLVSDLGHYLVENKECDFAMLWRYDHFSEQYWYSLRSDDAHADVSAVCKFYKGGGHRNASGFSSSLHPKDLFSYVKV